MCICELAFCLDVLILPKLFKKFVSCPHKLDNRRTMAPKNNFKENDIIKVLQGTHVGKTGVIIQRNAQRHRVSFTHGCGRRVRSGLVWYRYMQLRFRPQIGANLLDNVANLVDNVEVHPVAGVQGVEEEEKEDDDDLEDDDKEDDDAELEDEDDSEMEEHEDPEDAESMPEEDNEESDSDGLFEPEVEANDASTGEESTSIVPSRVTSKTRNRVSDNEQARNVTPGGDNQPEHRCTRWIMGEESLFVGTLWHPT
jgi:hypothetical protein